MPDAASLTETPIHSDSPPVVTSRERVQTALRHQQPDRVPVDLLMTPEVWAKMAAHWGLSSAPPAPGAFFDPAWEQVAQRMQSDLRVLSYDMFCQPPESVYKPGARPDWWNALSRSTPNRMWRQWMPDGTSYDIWGHHYRIVDNPTGAYEEFATWPHSAATSVEELKTFPWPQPDWWDFSSLPDAIRQLDPRRELYLRFRIGSVFELAWQIRGMQEFLMDLASMPAIPHYIMERMTDVHVENLKRVLEVAGDQLDMVYFYDDVATQRSLMISPAMWRDYVRPCHARIIEVAHKFDKPVMYHCDGAIAALIPELIDLGINVLNPIQPDSPGMEAERLKRDFGDRLTFHGGVDIIKTLPRGTPEEVRSEVRERIRVLGKDGGYIMCSSHHIQSDTPVENILTMYDVTLRYPEGDADKS